jgi:hypothetical protein
MRVVGGLAGGESMALRPLMADVLEVRGELDEALTRGRCCGSLPAAAPPTARDLVAFWRDLVSWCR